MRGRIRDGLRVLFSDLCKGSPRESIVHWYEHIELCGAGKEVEGKRSTHVRNHECIMDPGC